MMIESSVTVPQQAKELDTAQVSTGAATGAITCGIECAMILIDN